MIRKIPGAPPAEPRELLRAEDRMSFIYLEHAVIHRDANAITSTDARGTIHIPSATVGTLLLGPGTSISHHAVMLMADSGSTVVWVGERGVRYYAHGRPLARSSRLLDAQARLVSNQRSRLAVAREMYAMRFPGEDTSKSTMQQLRGREGARVKRVYREQSERTGVPWRRRDYVPADFDQADAVNKALSAANTSLYGAVHAVVVALGCAPGLGFVHTGNDRSFVYDVADLYKADLVIPNAFEAAAAEPEDIGAHTRRVMRDAMHESHLLERCVADVRRLLLPDRGQADDYNDVLQLWDDKSDPLASGQNHGSDDFEIDW